MRMVAVVRRRVSITLPPELVERAKKLGLNISKVCENALLDVIHRLEAEGTERTIKSPMWWTGGDLNPGPPPRQGGILPD